MRTFKDNAGRTWTVSVDIDAVRRVRSTLKLNLTNADFSETLQQLLGDPVLLCDVLYVICKPEADKAGVSDVDFGRAMAGDSIEHGTAALLEELENFTPNPRDRARVKRILAALRQYAEKTRDVAEIKLEALERQMTSGQPSGSSPAPSESTPDR